MVTARFAGASGKSAITEKDRRGVFFCSPTMDLAFYYDNNIIIHVVFIRRICARF